MGDFWLAVETPYMAALDSSPPSLETAYQDHYSRVYKLCLKILRDPTDAEDAAHNVFVHLATRLSSFRGESSFTTWIHRITVNYVLGTLRPKSKSKFHRTMPSLSAMLDDPEHYADTLKHALVQEDSTQRSTPARLDLAQAMQALPPAQRRAIEFHLAGYSAPELVGVTESTLGACKSNYRRAKRRLYKEMTKEMR